jgi:hypothetical protein
MLIIIMNIKRSVTRPRAWPMKSERSLTTSRRPREVYVCVTKQCYSATPRQRIRLYWRWESVLIFYNQFFSIFHWMWWSRQIVNVFKSKTAAVMWQNFRHGFLSVLHYRNTTTTPGLTVLCVEKTRRNV